MKKDFQLYILLILSVIYIPAAYLYVAADFVIRFFKGNMENKLKGDKNKLSVLIYAYIFIGAALSKYLLISSMYGLMMLLCLYAYNRTKENMNYINLHTVKKILYMVSLTVFIVGLVQFLNPQFSIPVKWVDNKAYSLNKRAYATFFNPNVFGFYINMILAAVIVNMKKINRLEVFVLLTGVISLFLTFSRTSWVSLPVTLVLLGIFVDKKYFVYAFIIAAVLIGLDKLFDIGRLNPLKAAKDSSIIYRLEIWKSCIEIFKDNMITGIGFGTLSKYITSYSTVVKSNIEHCHNIYLQVLTETGISGFSIFLYILYKLFRNISFKFKNKKNNHITVTYLALMIMIMLHSLVDSVLFTPQILMIINIIAGTMTDCNKSLYISDKIENHQILFTGFIKKNVG